LIPLFNTSPVSSSLTEDKSIAASVFTSSFSFCISKFCTSFFNVGSILVSSGWLVFSDKVRVLSSICSKSAFKTSTSLYKSVSLSFSISLLSLLEAVSSDLTTTWSPSDLFAVAIPISSFFTFPSSQILSSKTELLVISTEWVGRSSATTSDWVLFSSNWGTNPILSRIESRIIFTGMIDGSTAASTTFDDSKFNKTSGWHISVASSIISCSRRWILSVSSIICSLTTSTSSTSDWVLLSSNASETSTSTTSDWVLFSSNWGTNSISSRIESMIPFTAMVDGSIATSTTLDSMLFSSISLSVDGSHISSASSIFSSPIWSILSFSSIISSLTAPTSTTSSILSIFFGTEESLSS